MIFNNDLIFIHIGKTGGMSCSSYLLRNLAPPVYNCHLEVLSEMERLKAIEGIVPIPDIHRHCTLAEALEFIQKFNGKTIKDFTKIVAVIRHPYTLEYSYYKHLQKPSVRRRRSHEPHLLKLADGSFRSFVEKAQYHRDDHPQDTFFRVNDSVPDNVELIRFEQLTKAFPQAVAPFLKNKSINIFPHLNRTEYTSDIKRELTQEVKELLYKKHQFMFDSGLYSTDLV